MRQPVQPGRKGDDRLDSFRATEKSVAEMLALGRSLPEMLDALTQSTERQAGAICAVLLLDRDGKRLRYGAAPSLPPRWRESIDGLAVGLHTGSCGAAAYTGKRVISSNVATDPRWADCTELALPYGLHACSSVPIKSSEKKILGTFALFGREPRRPSPGQLKLMDRAEHLASVVIERKRAEDALGESEERFHSLTELTGDQYWEQDAEFRFTKITGGNMNSGVDPSVLIGKTRWEAGAEPVNSTWDEHRRLLEAHEPFHGLELRRADKSGQEFYLIVNGVPVFDANRVFKGYRGIGRDITAGKRAEQLLRLEHALLRESEERFRGLIELSSDWYWEQDENFRFTLVSDNLHDKTQRAGQAELEKTRWSVPALKMTEQDWIEHRAVLESRQPFRDLELRRTDRRGNVHIASVSGKPIFDADGKFKGYRGVGRNITASKQAEEKVRTSALQQRLIAELGRQALASSDLADVLNRAVELVSVTLKADCCDVLELEADKKQLIYTAAAGWPREWVGKRTVLVRPGSQPEYVLSRGEPVVVEDETKETRFVPSRLQEFGVRSGMRVPLIGTQGVFGILSAHALQPRRFSPDDVSFLQSVGNILAVAMERKNAEDRLAYLAQFDTLTGLPNRHLFHDRLLQTMAQAKRSGHPMAMLFVDLDRFKLVNDTLGHGAGDKLLKEAAARLSRCVRTGDTAGRFGGDEFGAILMDLAKPGDAGLVAQKILDALAQPFNLDGQDAFISASIGITLFPNDGDNPEALVMNADTAMYRAKEQGRNIYQFFTREMNERALQRVQMEAALRRALERKEFLLHYQPKVDLKTGKICGLEALLRWRHPEKGVVLPGEFVPILEDAGLIVQVGEWAIREVCAQINAWRDASFSVPPVTVNLSARQFQQKDLESTVRRILRETRVAPAFLQFELTESLLMQEPEAAARTLRGLRESGVKLSVDDFGTGYSSLAYLKRFPLDSLKIDRTFIRDITTDPEDAAITLAIIGLAHNLNVKVVAEGVETREQLELLRKNGCDEIQGYLFSMPTTADACARMLHEGRQLD
ncbi:MAG TPA: EAL domain-containing protein [Burkholderiales bacterium]